MSRQSNSFKITKGLINLTSGERSSIGRNYMYLCVEDGDLELKYKDGSTETLACKTGNAFAFDWYTNAMPQGVDTITIVSGKFHIGD